MPINEYQTAPLHQTYYSLLLADEVAGHSPADQLPKLKKHERHQFDVCPPSSDCLVVYNQFET